MITWLVYFPGISHITLQSLKARRWLISTLNSYDVARNAHAGQRDKAGKDYILHPVYVASHFTNRNDIDVALLHDVVEDSPYTINDLQAIGFNDEILAAVDAITKKPRQDYASYLAVVKANDIARRVKIEDLKHNMDTSRLLNVSDKDKKRLEKYENALEYLQST